MMFAGLLLGLTLPAGATDPTQPLTTMELVHIYPSEDALHAAHPELFPERKPIIHNEEYVSFIAPETGTVLKRIRKEGEFFYTEEDYAYLADVNNTEPLIKSGRSYYVPNERPYYLIINEFETSWEPGFEGEPEYHYAGRTLYNKQGEKILEMPLGTNLVQFSPAKTHFVAYYNGIEQVVPVTCFYTADGELLRRLDNFSGNITYSANGEYVAIWGEVGNFETFTKQGESLLQGTFLDYAPKNWTLYNVFISNDGEYSLLSLSLQAVLINQAGVKQWAIPSSIVVNAQFIPQQDLVVICSINDVMQRTGSETMFMVRAVSMSTGAVLDEMTMVKDYMFTDNAILINVEENYHEYTIK